MTGWQRWVRQPQQVWLRRATFQVHLWSGMLLGVYVFVLSVSGVLLIFNREYIRWVRATYGDNSTPETWYFWLASLHDELLLGRDGQWWNGLLSMFVTLLVLTGLVVWWPGRGRWKRSLTVKTTAGWRAFNWDLHSAIGFWLFFFLLIWGISGVYLGIPEPFARLAEMTASDDGWNPVDVVTLWMTRMHFGRWRTFWLKCVWAVLGLAPAIMFVTGAVMWWNRVVKPWLRAPARDAQRAGQPLLEQ